MTESKITDAQLAALFGVYVISNSTHMEKSAFIVTPYETLILDERTKTYAWWPPAHSEEQAVLFFTSQNDAFRREQQKLRCDLYGCECPAFLALFFDQECCERCGHQASAHNQPKHQDPVDPMATTDPE